MMGATYTRSTPFPRAFDCRYCGSHVEVIDRSDHRTVYCSQRCEREYWRKASKNQLGKKLERGHVVDEGRERLYMEWE